MKNIFEKSYLSSKSLDFFLGSMLLALAFISSYYFFDIAWSYFLENCPNQDVMSWDENIRLVTVLDQYSDFHLGRWYSAILPFFEAPTWPPLRSFITLMLLYIPTGYSVILEDSFLGLVFLALTFLSIAIVSYSITKNLLYAGLITLVSLGFLIHTFEVPAYSLSSMLETQAMFASIWCFYYLYQIYLCKGEITSRLKWGLGISLLFFFFTKYPYGLMLFIALTIVESLRSPNGIFRLVEHALLNHYKGIRRFLLILILIALLGLPFVKKLGLIDANLRIYKLMYYYLTLPLFLDFNYFLWKQKLPLRKIIPSSLRAIYILGIMPSLFWIYLNPDRVTSLIGASNIVNKFTKSFFYSLIASPSGDIFLPQAVFDSPWAIRIMIFFAVISVLFWFRQQFISKKSQESFRMQEPRNISESDLSWSKNLSSRLKDLEIGPFRIFKDPLIGLTLILFFQIFILEITTSNKQQRYVLQFIPCLSLLTSLWIIRPMQESIFNKSNYLQRAWQVIAAIAFLVSVGLFANDRGFWTKSYSDTRYYCLRGEDANIFEPARWISAQLPLDQNLILVNGFHEDIHFDKEGRLLASEIDVLIRMSRYKNFIIRNDHKYNMKTWDDFDSLVAISPICEDPFLQEKIRTRSDKLKTKLEIHSRVEHPSKEYCLTQYNIIHTSVK